MYKLWRKFKKFNGNICPSCGHKINSKVVNKYLKEFTDRIYKSENKIEDFLQKKSLLNI